jgi:hypothetical protein
MLTTSRTRDLTIAALLLTLGTGCNSAACFSDSGKASKRFDDCQTRCDAGDDAACDRRSAIEAEMSVECNMRNVSSSCRALCNGRKHDTGACDKLRSMRSM